MNRRRFLKYAGATAAVVGAAALGLDLLSTHTPLPTQQPTTAGVHQPPAINNLQWTPTRIVNGKVYDGTVSFDAVGSDSTVVGAELTFDPIYPQELSMQAFTPEPGRSYSLSSDTMTANFSQSIPNLVGGKQYKAQVTVKDQYVGQNQANLEVPYIRELENIAKDAGILVGASYFTWLSSPWYKLSPNVTPLLGLYNTKDSLVASKHIDWATGFGVHHFYFAYTPGEQDGGIMAADQRVEALVSNSSIRDIKFAIFYETGERLAAGSTAGLSHVNLNDPSTFSIIQSDFEHIAENYFSHPSYLTVDDRPVVYIYATGLIAGDIVAPFTKLRKYLNGLGFNIFIIGDELEIRWGQEMDQRRLQAFDAITGYTLPPTGPDVNRSTSAVRAEYSRWQSAIDYDAVRYYTGHTSSPNSGLIHTRTDVLNAVHDDLAYAIKHFGSNPAYLRYHGEPVIFVFGPASLAPSEWLQVMQQLSNEGLGAYYVSMQADDFLLDHYYPQFQGFFPWIPAAEIMRRETTSVAYIGDRGSAMRALNANHGISIGMGVWPGFDDSAVGGWCGPDGTRKVPRMGGTVYNQTWDEALRFHPNFVHVVTFNDWNEGTIIEPSIQSGYQYLYATAYYAAQFKWPHQSYDGIPVPLEIYNATLTLRQAQADGRTVGLDAANQSLTQANQAFQSRQYSDADRLAKQAIQLASQTTFPRTSTSSGPFIVSAETTSSTNNLEFPSWILYWVVMWLVAGSAAIIIVVYVRRRRS